MLELESSIGCDTTMAVGDTMTALKDNLTHALSQRAAMKGVSPDINADATAQSEALLAGFQIKS